VINIKSVAHTFEDTEENDFNIYAGTKSDKVPIDKIRFSLCVGDYVTGVIETDDIGDVDSKVEEVVIEHPDVTTYINNIRHFLPDDESEFFVVLGSFEQDVHKNDS